MSSHRIKPNRKKGTIKSSDREFQLVVSDKGRMLRVSNEK